MRKITYFVLCIYNFNIFAEISVMGTMNLLRIEFPPLEVV